jgi:hypothetical protein
MVIFLIFIMNFYQNVRLEAIKGFIFGEVSGVFSGQMRQNSHTKNKGRR